MWKFGVVNSGDDDNVRYYFVVLIALCVESDVRIIIVRLKNVVNL